MTTELTIYTHHSSLQHNIDLKSNQSQKTDPVWKSRCPDTYQYYNIIPLKSTLTSNAKESRKKVIFV